VWQAQRDTALYSADKAQAAAAGSFLFAAALVLVGEVLKRRRLTSFVAAALQKKPPHPDCICKFAFSCSFAIRCVVITYLKK